MCQQGQQGALAVPDDIDGVVRVTLADDLDQHGQAHGRKDHVLAPCRRKQRMGHGAAKPVQRDETEQLAVETLAPHVRQVGGGIDELPAFLGAGLVQPVAVAVQPFAVGRGLVDVLLFLAEAPVERYDYAAYGGPAGATGELAPVVDDVGVLCLAFVVRRQAVARRRQVAGIGLPAGQGRRHVQAFIEPLAEPSLDPFVATREIVDAMHHDGHARLGRRRHQVHVAALGQGDGLGRDDRPRPNPMVHGFSPCRSSALRRARQVASSSSIQLPGSPARQNSTAMLETVCRCRRLRSLK